MDFVPITVMGEQIVPGLFKVWVAGSPLPAWGEQAPDLAEALKLGERHVVGVVLTRLIPALAT